MDIAIKVLAEIDFARKEPSLIVPLGLTGPFCVIGPSENSFHDGSAPSKEIEIRRKRFNRVGMYQRTIATPWPAETTPNAIELRTAHPPGP
jgi:hypothetical protein